MLPVNKKMVKNILKPLSLPNVVSLSKEPNIKSVIKRVVIVYYDVSYYNIDFIRVIIL